MTKTKRKAVKPVKAWAIVRDGKIVQAFAMPKREIWYDDCTETFVRVLIAVIK